MTCSGSDGSSHNTIKVTVCQSSTPSSHTSHEKATGSKDFTITITLNSNWKKYWDFVGNTDNTSGKFYYKSVLETGKTTEQLVKSVTLDDDPVEDAYLTFDFYLNVIADSIQVVNDDLTGNEEIDPVATYWDGAKGNTKTSTDATATNQTIPTEDLTWGTATQSE